MKNKIIARDRAHLVTLVSNEINNNGVKCDLNHIDVSLIKDMNRLFFGRDFNGNISEWDVSNVTDMVCLFENCSFNGDISKWNVGNVLNMNRMFSSSKFNGDISNWDTSKVTSMLMMFSMSEFNRDISQWDVSNVKDMDYMFYKSHFDKDLNGWKPYSISSPSNTIDESPCSPPYWLEYDTPGERKKVIDAYHLKKELDSSLSINDNQKKRLKI